MNKQILKEIILTVFILVMILISCNMKMADDMYVILHGFLVLSFGVLSLMIWSSKSEDERHKYHRAFSSEVGFFSGALTLIAIIAYQSIFKHEVGIWLLVILGVMVVSRTLTQYLMEKKC